MKKCIKLVISKNLLRVKVFTLYENLNYKRVARATDGRLPTETLSYERGKDPDTETELRDFRYTVIHYAWDFFSYNISGFTWDCAHLNG